jgi:hypothetical protein
VLFVPETRYTRDVDHSLIGVENMALDETSPDKPKIAQMTETRATPRAGSISTTPGKMWTKELNPWSGINKMTSYFELFLRPFPLFAYPAVLWAILGCEISQKRREHGARI